MAPNLVKGNVPEMSCVLARGNVPEMSCVLATGNLPEILPYTVPGKVKKMSKFPGVENVHTMNRKCELSCTFHGISWPRKFRISSSECAYQYLAPLSPLGLHVGKTRGFDSVLSGRCASRVGDLTLDLIKSPSNPLSGTRIRRGFDHLTCPNGGVFNHLFDQIPTLPHTLPQGGIVGPTINRCIMPAQKASDYSKTDNTSP